MKIISSRSRKEICSLVRSERLSAMSQRERQHLRVRLMRASNHGTQGFRVLEESAAAVLPRAPGYIGTHAHPALQQNTLCTAAAIYPRQAI